MANTKMDAEYAHKVWAEKNLEGKKKLLLNYLESLPQIDSIKKLIDDVNTKTKSTNRADEFAANLYLQGLNLYTKAGSDSDIMKKRMNYLKNKKKKNIKEEQLDLIPHVAYGNTEEDLFDNKMIDFRFLRMLPKDLYKKFYNAFMTNGVAGYAKKLGKYLIFTRSTIKSKSKVPSDMPVLPLNWKDYLRILDSLF